MSELSPSRETQPSNPTTWVDRYGNSLYRYALLRVSQRDVAEDLVQETFLAALKGRAHFSARSSEKTWMLGILKRKIVDHYRRVGPTQSASTPTADDAVVTQFFRENGQWKTNLRSWPSNPQRVLENREFWDVLQMCLAKLPHTLSAAFALREMEELNTDHACEVLKITPSNLSVRLHRARLLLRRCLERSWFSTRS